MRASLPVNLPWIRSIMFVGNDGLSSARRSTCQVGLNLGDRDYFKKAPRDPRLRLQRYLFASPTNRPIVMAAYPVAAINPRVDAVIVAGINLDWLSKIMSNLGGRPGISAVLVDATGIVLAAPADQASLIGRPLDTIPLLSADRREGAQLRRAVKARFRSPPPTAPSARSASPAFPARNRA